MCMDEIRVLIWGFGGDIALLETDSFTAAIFLKFSMTIRPFSIL